MVDKSMTVRLRRAARVQAIVANHAAKPGVGAVGADMVAAAKRLEAAQAAYDVAEGAWAREGGEAVAARTPLATAYDTARAVVMKLLPHVSVNNAASGLATPDDLLTAAERLEGILVDHADQAWVAPLYDPLAAAVDTAAREWAEAVKARGALSEASRERRLAAATFDAELSGFRFVVRTELGRRSPDYQAIRTRRKGDDEQPATPQP